MRGLTPVSDTEEKALQFFFPPYWYIFHKEGEKSVDQVFLHCPYP